MDIKKLNETINSCAENIEYLKVLYENHNRTTPENSFVDAKAIVKYENEIKNAKWDIVQTLSDSNTYEQWIASDNNKSALLAQSVQRGHFQHELATETALLEKLSSLPEIGVITTNEKNRIKHYQNSTPSKPMYDYKKEEQQVLQVYDKDRCFSKSYLEVASTTSPYPQVQQILSLVRSNPALFGDHPQHLTVNPLERALTTREFKELLSDTSNNLPQIEQFAQHLEDIVAKKPHITHIKQYRETVSPEKNIGPTLV